MTPAVSSGSARRARDRGAASLEYCGLLVVAALILGALTALGIQEQTAHRGEAAVCTIVRAADCGLDGKPAVEKKKDGGCHGFWGCTWSGTRHVGGGVWGAAKDTGSGLKALFTTNPVTTVKGIGSWLWSESPIQQGRRAWTSCRAGDMRTCSDSVSCIAMGPSCLVRDMVVDEKTKEDLARHRWGDASGRILWNGGTLFVPAKIPGLNVLGKGGKAAEGAGRVTTGAAEAGKTSTAFRDAVRALGGARKRGPGSRLLYTDVRAIAGELRKLSPAERTTFLDTLTPDELRAMYDAAPGIRNLRSDLLEAASPSALRSLKPENPAFPNAGGWRTFRGNLWRDRGPSWDDIEQGRAGNCWCLAAAEADVAMAPATVRKMISKNPNGTYTVAFGDGTRVTVTPEIPVNGARVSDEAGWPAILEKAMAERAGGYDLPNGGAAADALRWITGKEPIPYSGHTLPTVRTIAGHLHDGDVMVVSFKKDARISGIEDAAKRGIYSFHSYAVVGADPVEKTVTLKNPHGPTSETVMLTEKEFRGTEGLNLLRAGE